MKTRIVLFLTVAIWLIVGAVLLWRGRHALGTARAQLAANMSRQSELDAGIGEVRAHLAQDQQAAAQLRQKARAARPAVNPMAAAQPGLSMIISHPQLYQAFIDYYRASLGQRYGAFYKMMGLSPDQIAKFEDILTKAQSNQLDLVAAALNQHENLTDPAVRQALLATVKQLNADESGLLGPAVFQQLQQYNRAQVAMGVSMTAAYLALDSEPITDEQAGKVMQAVAAASPSYQKGGAVNLQTVDWDAASGQAAKVLSASQLAAFKSAVDAIQLNALVAGYVAQTKK